MISWLTLSRSHGNYLLAGYTGLYDHHLYTPARYTERNQGYETHTVKTFQKLGHPYLWRTTFGPPLQSGRLRRKREADYADPRAEAEIL